MEDNIAKTISNARIFGSLSSEDVNALIKLGEKRHWPKGARLYGRGI